MGEDLLVKPEAPELGAIERLLARSDLSPAKAVLAWDVQDSRWLTVVGVDETQSRLAIYSRIAAEATTESEADQTADILLVDRHGASLDKMLAVARRRTAQPTTASFYVEGRELLDPVQVTNHAALFEAEVLHWLKAMKGVEDLSSEHFSNLPRAADALLRSGDTTWCFEIKAGKRPVDARHVVQLAGWVHLLQERLGRPVRGVLIVESPLTARALEWLNSAPDLSVIDWSQAEAAEELRSRIA